MNGSKGNVKDGSDVGVPQGSVLSPILFKIFMMDLVEDLNSNNDVVIYKFADDGTMKISAETTNSCLDTVQTVLSSVYKWAHKWRMVINCDPNKTELICFNTAEKDRNQIPKQYKLGEKIVKLVSQTKVLGLIMDENLSFIQHAEMVYNRLTSKWVLICNSCNRQWGFTQRIMIQLLRTLFLPTLLYASHIWMTRNNMKDINKLYYKMIKSTVGAVFNVKQSLCELILGIPPIHIQNTVNQVKHYLKININKNADDQLEEFIISHITTENQKPLDLQIALKQVFKFLQWKVRLHEEHFTDNDKKKIQHRELSEFCTLSQKSCSYSKTDIKKYTELLWKESIRNEYMCEGHSILPIPSCQQLPLQNTVNRQTEVLLMSLFYENNLLNGFLHKVHIRDCESPLCYCGDVIQTSTHIIFQCEEIPNESRDMALQSLQEVIGNIDVRAINNTAILNGSRNRKFLTSVLNIIHLHGDKLRNTVEI